MFQIELPQIYLEASKSMKQFNAFLKETLMKDVVY